MTHSLYLSPADPWLPPPTPNALLTVLQHLGFVGKKLTANTWLAGDQLLSHITFAGCSPHLEFSPPADGSRDFCHVSLLGPYQTPQIVTGPHTQKPRCPSCKTRIAEWQPFAERYTQTPEAPWTCPQCTTTAHLDELRWRHSAAFGRCFVLVHSVFPSEGLPSDELLAALGELTNGVDWQYAWAASRN